MSKVVTVEVRCDVCLVVQKQTDFEGTLTVEVLNLDVCRKCAPKTKVQRLFEIYNERT